MPQNEPKTCQQPDRDEPKLTCGYPIPCPHHTVLVDATKLPALVTGAEHLPASIRRKLQQIGDAAGSDEQLADWSDCPDADLEKAHHQLAGNFSELNDDGHRYLREINTEKRRRQFQATTNFGRKIRKLFETVSAKLTWLMLEGGIDYIRIRRTDDKRDGVTVTFAIGRYLPDDSQDRLGGNIELRALDLIHASNMTGYVLNRVADLVGKIKKAKDDGAITDQMIHEISRHPPEQPDE